MQPQPRQNHASSGPVHQYVHLNFRPQDNDPAGYKSKKALDAKDSLGITALDFPRYSPDLNPMDFFLWEEVERRMTKSAQRGPDRQLENPCIHGRIVSQTLHTT